MTHPGLQYTETYRFPGCRMRVDSVVKFALSDLTRVYGWFRDVTQSPGNMNFVIRRRKGCLQFTSNGGRASIQSMTIGYGQVMPLLEREINKQLAEGLGHQLLLHSAAATHADRAIVLAADSGAGKTTLVATLVRNGFGYLTDELVIIHLLRGGIVPFPKALSLKEGAFGLFESLGPEPTGPPYDRVWYLDPEQLRPGSVVKTPTSIGWVVFPRFEAGTKTRIEALTVGETVLGLFENTVNMARHKVAGLDRLIAIAKKAPGYRLVFGDLEDACDAVLELVGANDEPRC